MHEQNELRPVGFFASKVTLQLLEVSLTDSNTIPDLAHLRCAQLWRACQWLWRLPVHHLPGSRVRP